MLVRVRPPLVATSQLLLETWAVEGVVVAVEGIAAMAVAVRGAVVTAPSLAT